MESLNNIEGKTEVKSIFLKNVLVGLWILTLLIAIQPISKMTGSYILSLNKKDSVLSKKPVIFKEKIASVNQNTIDISDEMVPEQSVNLEQFNVFELHAETSMHKDVGKDNIKQLNEITPSIGE